MARIDSQNILNLNLVLPDTYQEPLKTTSTATNTTTTIQTANNLMASFEDQRTNGNPINKNPNAYNINNNNKRYAGSGGSDSQIHQSQLKMHLKQFKLVLFKN